MLSRKLFFPFCQGNKFRFLTSGNKFRVFCDKNNPVSKEVLNLADNINKTTIANELRELNTNINLFRKLNENILEIKKSRKTDMTNELKELNRYIFVFGVLISCCLIFIAMTYGYVLENQH